MSPSGAPPPAPEPLPTPAVDSHCHLDLILADADDEAELQAVLDAASAVGVPTVVTVGVDVPTSQWSAQAAARHQQVYAAVAIHPNESQDADEPAWAEIARLAREPRVVAVGETGLDYFRDSATPAAQQESFRRHIEIAKATGRALVIHDRDAHDDVLRILDEVGPPERTVMHCFSGDAGFARRCVERGYLLSFAGTLTFANAPYLREAAAATPLEQVLVETDAPFLAPVPHRGRPNAPYLIPITVRALAAATGRDVAEVAAAVRENAARVFRLPG